MSMPKPSFDAEWKSFPEAARISPRRSGHVAFTVNANFTNTVYVFGGYVEEDPPPKKKKGGDKLNRYVTNDQWKFEGVEKGWSAVKQFGELPGPRLASAAVNLPFGKTYIFGGWDPQTEGTGGTILDTVHELGCDGWEEVAKFPDGPTSRLCAVALPGKDQILVHNHRCLEHVWIFDTDSYEFTKQPTTGQGPGSLGLHVACMIDDSTFFVFGGATQDGTMSNASFFLDTNTWKWTPVRLVDPSKCPSPRAGASICSYSGTESDKKCAVLFGGAEATEAGLNPRGDVWVMHLLDAKKGKGEWELLLNDDIQNEYYPPPRNAATLTQIASDEKSAEFLVTGGWAPFRVTHDDVFVLSLTEVANEDAKGTETEEVPKDNEEGQSEKEKPKETTSEEKDNTAAPTGRNIMGGLDEFDRRVLVWFGYFGESPPVWMGVLRPPGDFYSQQSLTKVANEDAKGTETEEVPTDNEEGQSEKEKPKETTAKEKDNTAAPTGRNGMGGLDKFDRHVIFIPNTSIRTKMFNLFKSKAWPKAPQYHAVTNKKMETPYQYIFPTDVMKQKFLDRWATISTTTDVEVEVGTEDNETGDNEEQ